MAKFKPMAELDKDFKSSDIVGLLDLNEDEELCVFVDENAYRFEDIKHLFVGGTIEMHSLVPIKE